MESIGQILKTARIEKNLTLEDIEKATSIRCKYLQAIEEDNFAETPGEVFVKGIIRTYGNYLGLDGLELVNMYKASKTGQLIDDIKSEGIREVNNVKLNISLKPQKNIGDGSSFSMSPNRFPLKKILIGVAAAVVIGCGYLGAGKLMDMLPAGSDNDMATTVSSTQGTVKPVEKPVQAIADKIVVDMQANDQCWLEVKADGKEVFVGMLQNGDKKVFEAKDKLIIKYGNIGAMKVIVNGQPADLTGEHGVSVKTYTR